MNLYRSSALSGLAVLFLLAYGVPRRDFLSSPQAPAPAAEVTAVEGGGFLSALACAGCAAGAVGILAGGWAALVAAAWTPGSTLIVAGCIGACVNAFK
jgi:hypothetical protein